MLDLLGNMDALTKAIAFAVTAVGAMFGIYRWFRPKWRAISADVQAGRDALVGRDAVVDSITGKELAPALPGIGVRMATMETAVAKLVETTLRLDDHELRITSLEEGAVERVAAKLESAQAWRAVEAVAKATPAPVQDPVLDGLGEN